MAQKLTGEARKSALARLNGWSEVAGRDAIAKKFLFKGFQRSLGFMPRAALIAEKMDHHPEWLQCLQDRRSDALDPRCRY